MPKFLFSLLFSILLSACSNADIYNNFVDLPSDGWQKNSALQFPVEITDADVPYNVYINIRNTAHYRYQNLWLFIYIIFPDGKVAKDTIDFYLADSRGQWLGSGVGELRNMQVLFQQNYRFSQAGKYVFNVEQGMRADALEGISSVGLQLTVNN